MHGYGIRTLIKLQSKITKSLRYDSKNNKFSEFIYIAVNSMVWNCQNENAFSASSVLAYVHIRVQSENKIKAIDTVNIPCFLTIIQVHRKFKKKYF